MRPYGIRMGAMRADSAMTDEPMANPGTPPDMGNARTEMLTGDHIGCWRCEAIWLAGKRHSPRERCAEGERYDFHPEGYVAFDNGCGVSSLYSYVVDDDGRSGTIRSRGPLGPEYDLKFRMLGDGRMEMRMGCVEGYLTYEKILDEPRKLEGYPHLSELTKTLFFERWHAGELGNSEA